MDSLESLHDRVEYGVLDSPYRIIPAGHWPSAVLVCGPLNFDGTELRKTVWRISDGLIVGGKEWRENLAETRSLFFGNSEMFSTKEEYFSVRPDRHVSVAADAANAETNKGLRWKS